MQQKLMSYQIFTEIFRSANRELNSMASELLVSSKQEVVGPSSNRPVETHQASAQLSLTASEIKSDMTVQQASVLSKDYAVLQPQHSRWKKSSVQAEQALQQVLRECNKQQDSTPTYTIKQLKDLLSAKQKIIGELVKSRQEMQMTARNCQHQLSSKIKQQQTFREIISNLEEDIMQFRSEIKKSELEAKQTAEKHFKEVQGYQQELAELKQMAKQARVKNTLILKDKEAELQTKDAQLSESIDTNSHLLDELIVLRKDKDIRKEQVDKQHQLIIQYEKRNEQTNREVNRLSEEVLQLKQQLSKQGMASMSSTLLFKNSRTAIVTKPTTGRTKRSSSIPTKRCESNIKAKVFGLRKQLAELKQGSKQLLQKLGKYMMEVVQNIVGMMQALHNDRMTQRNEQLQALRKEMIKLKVEVFELQLKQESARLSTNQNRNTDGFWMAKLLESANGMESAKGSHHLNRTTGFGRETVINNPVSTNNSKRNSARRLAKDYDSQRKNQQAPDSTKKM